MAELYCGNCYCVIRKKLKKGVLLYIHLNLAIALLLALLVFVAGVETATSVPVSLLIVARGVIMIS